MKPIKDMKRERERKRNKKERLIDRDRESTIQSQTDRSLCSKKKVAMQRVSSRERFASISAANSVGSWARRLCVLHTHMHYFAWGLKNGGGVW